MLGRRRHLAEGDVEAVGHEHRIEAKALVAARRPDHRAGHLADIEVVAAIGMGEAERGVERALAQARRVGADRLQPVLDAAHRHLVVAADAASAPSRRYRRRARRRAHRPQRPESSASATMPAALAAACALMRAFSTNVVPVSSGSGRPRSAAEIRTSPSGVNSSRNSASLPALCVASSSFSPRLSRGMITPSMRDRFCSAVSSRDARPRPAPSAR